MKSVKIIMTALVAVVMSVNTFAQTSNPSKKVTTKTETVKVWGKCDMCKSVIEKAAKVDGVSKAEWNKETKLITLVYDPSKVKSDDIQKKIAASGYDTEKYKAENTAYNNLPGCCKYERSK